MSEHEWINDDGLMIVVHEDDNGIVKSEYAALAILLQMAGFETL